MNMNIFGKRNVECIYCKSNDFQFFDKYYYGKRLNIKNIVICKICKLKQADFIPSDQILSHFYNDINTRMLFDTNRKNLENFNNTFKSFDSFLDYIILKSNLRVEDNLNVIDIGAGNGRSLMQFKNLTNWNAIGIEPDNTKCKILKFFNLKYINETFQKIESQLKNMNYDLVITSQVLEHLSDPIDILKKINNKLKTNGNLWIDVPMCNKNYFNSRKIDDVGHLYFFDEESLLKIVKKANFSVISRGSFGDKILKSRNLISTLYQAIKYHLFQFVPLSFLNFKKKIIYNKDNFKISDLNSIFVKSDVKIYENNFEHSRLYFLLKKN